MRKRDTPSFADDTAAQQRFLDAIKADPTLSIRAAIHQANGRRKTIYRRADVRALIDTNDDFRARYEEARGRNLDAVEQTLWQIALDKQHPSCFRAIKLILAAHDARYGDKIRVEQTGADGGPLEVTHVDTDAAVASIRARLAPVIDIGAAASAQNGHRNGNGGARR